MLMFSTRGWQQHKKRAFESHFLFTHPVLRFNWQFWVSVKFAFCFFYVLCEGDHGKVGVNTAEAALSHLALEIFSSFKLFKFWI